MQVRAELLAKQHAFGAQLMPLLLLELGVLERTTAAARWPQGDATEVRALFDDAPLYLIKPPPPPSLRCARCSSCSRVDRWRRTDATTASRCPKGRATPPLPLLPTGRPNF